MKNERDGRVMEVLNYIKDNRSYVVECAWFDLDKKEIRTHRFKQEALLKAS